MKDIKSFIESLVVPARLKVELAQEQVLQHHSFYLQLAHYLAPAFSRIDSSKLDKLQGYSYLYFRFLLTLDNLIDGLENDSLRTTKNLFDILSLHEQAIRGLADLFRADDEFWVDFEFYKQEYAASNLLEKQLSVTRQAYTQDSFEKIAAGKSAICHAMVHALRSLANDAGPVEKLRECLFHLHIGMQCLDDINDFRQDWRNGQYTYAHSLLLQKLREINISSDEILEEKLYQYFFTTGVAQFLLELGSSHYERSITLAQKLNLLDFEHFLRQQLHKCVTFKGDIESLLLKTRIKSSKSSQLVRSLPFYTSADVLLEALQTGMRYLNANREADGCWTDFMTSAGQSKMWVTSYAGLQLAETKLGNGLAYDAFNASYYLPGAYNEGILQDGDSTTFAMGLRCKVWGEIDPVQVKNWLSFMDADGGWVTYRNESQLRKRLDLPVHISVAAWLSPKLCVTAAAAYVLRTYPEQTAKYELTCDYLVSQQHPNGYWESYWWTSPIYATAYAILALADSPTHYASSLRALDWLVAHQMENGAWTELLTSKRESAFYTALAVKALLSSNKDAFLSAAKRGASWLLSQQMTDGSWTTARILRIPATNIEQPNQVVRWRNSSFGVNVLVDDHNRIFTTATVFNALNAYADMHEFIVYQSLN